MTSHSPITHHAANQPNLDFFSHGCLKRRGGEKGKGGKGGDYGWLRICFNIIYARRREGETEGVRETEG